MKTSILPKTVRRSLHLITLGGCLAMVYVAGISSPVSTEFFRHLGASELQFGLLRGIPLIALIFQFVGAGLSNRVSNRKRLFMTLLISARLLYLPVALLPILFPSMPPELAVSLLISLVAASAAMMNLGSPSWFAWMADLVPRRVLNSYWGTRQRWMFLTWAVCYVSVAGYSYAVKLPIQVSFALLLGVAVAAGVSDILLFRTVHEPANFTTRGRAHFEVLLEPFRHREYRRFLIVIASQSASMMIAAAFMQLYVLKILCLPLWQVVVIWCMFGLGNALAAPAWGRLADRHGHKPVLAICMFFKPLAPLVFLLISAHNAIFILPLFFLFDASWNAGLMVARNGYMMKIAPQQNRSMFVAAMTGLAGVSAGVASIAGGYVLKGLSGSEWQALGRTWTNYHALFFLSFLMRIGATALVHWMDEPKSTRPVHVLNEVWGRWPLRFFRFPVGLYQRRQE